DHFGDQLRIQLAGVLRVPAVGDIGRGADATALDLDRQPARLVDTGHHLALVQIGRHRFRVFGGDAQRPPPAGAATVEAEHETGPLRRAAIADRIDAEGAVI